MTDEEKKFSLDELPDEGSTPQPKPRPKKNPPKQIDPRVTNLKTMSDTSKVEAMVTTWHFDRPDFSFYWVPWAGTLVAAQMTGFSRGIRHDIQMIKDNPYSIGSDVFIFALDIGGLFLKHPIILIVLLPMIFRFRKVSDYHFDVKFDGISTVRKYLPYGSTELITRTFIKWEEILKIKKEVINGKEILRIYSPDGHIADIIWYIELEKKRAFRVLLNGMIIPKHPMRIFLDNEKDLK